MYWPASVAGLFAAGSLAFAVRSIVRNDVPTGSRVLRVFFGLLATGVFAYMVLAFLYLAACEPTMSCS